MTLIDASSSFRSDTHKTIHMGGITVETEPMGRLGLRIHWFRISRIADRYLSPVPAETFQRQPIMYEFNRLAG